MQSKSLLIAIAAFAVTTTGASAYGEAILERANLTDDQRSALEQAHELRQSGDREAARDLLVDAGIDEDVLEELRSAAREAKEAIKTAVANGDYETFLTLTADLPLGEQITSEADFAKLQAAHELRQAGDRAGARAILDELGIEKPAHKHRPAKRHLNSQLTDEQREAMQVARQANDRETVRAILEEAGVERPDRL